MSRTAEDGTAETHVTNATSGPPRTPCSRVRARVGQLDAVLVVIVATGAILRFWRLGAQSLWYDEWLTAGAVSGSVRQLLGHVASGEGIAPSYFVLMWGWVRLFGDGEAAMRAFSALIGTATVPVAYAIARELGQRRTVARVAALLVAVNPMLVWYSQEARPYSLLAFLGGLSLLAFARARNRGRRGDFIVWGAVCACAVAVHYFAVFIVVAEAIALLRLRRRQWRELLLAGAPVAVVLAVLAPFALTQHSHSPNHQWISGFELRDRLSEAGRAALVGPSPPHGRVWIAAAVIVAMAALLTVTRAHRDERSAAALTAIIAGAAVVTPLVAALIGIDVFLGRYLIASLVPLVVAVSVGLATRRARWVGGAAVLALCGISLGTVVAVARDADLQKPDWRSVAEVFETGSANRLLLMNVHGRLASPLLYYLHDVRKLRDGPTTRVDQIDVLVAKPTTKPCNFLVGPPCALVFLGAPLPEPIAGEFTLEERHELGQFTIDRYRAIRPLAVTLAQLVTPQDLPGALALVNDRAGQS